MGFTLTKHGSGGGLHNPQFLLPSGDRWAFYFGNLAINENYVTGGFTVDLRDFFIASAGVWFASNSTYIFHYNPATAKVEIYSAPGTEVVNGVGVNTNVHFMTLGILK